MIADHPDTYMFLRIPFPFVASVFYGYFTQVVSSERTLREEAEKEARRDFLTSLPNRKAFEERIREETERAERYERSLSLLIVDIDNFKTINDSLGHQWGDVVLQSIAMLLKNNVRRAVFVARLGGDEFIVILPETDGKNAADVAERICSEIKQHPFDTPNGLYLITVSIGVRSNLTGDHSDHTKMSLDADRALYLAKQRGRDQVAVLSTTSQH